MLVRGKYHMLQNAALKPKNFVRMSIPVPSRSIRTDACCGDFYPQGCGSVSECVVSQGWRRCCEHPDICQTGAAIECIIFDTLHAGGYCNVRQTGTTLKCTIADTRYVGGYDDAC